jgi:hypothetical protein
MGTWSVSLYGSDTASDIRDQIRELLRTPLDVQAIVDALGASFPALNDKNDEEYSDLWLVVADQFHRHGVQAPGVFATAVSIIETGLDLKVKRALSMSERDLTKRAKVLTELRDRWATPHPKPIKRKIQVQADAFIFDVGDCVCYRSPTPIRIGGTTDTAPWPCWRGAIISARLRGTPLRG